MLTKDHKDQIVKEFGKTGANTGSTAVQIALITERIDYITNHLKSFPKDKHSRLGLLKLVGQRRRLGKYLHRQDVAAYDSLMDKLNIRRGR